MFELKYQGATYGIPLSRLSYVVIKPDRLWGGSFPWRSSSCVLEVVIRNMHLTFPRPRHEAAKIYQQIFEAYTAAMVQV